MSAMSLRNSALNSVTGSPGCESMGSGYLRIFKIISVFLKAPYLFDVSAEISLHFKGRVAAELLLGHAGNGESHHGFGHHAGCGNPANIAAFVTCAGGLAVVKANRLERFAQGGDGLQVAAHYNVFAVGDAAFKA